MSDRTFFVGYAPTPNADRRFLLRAGLGLVAGSGVLGATIAALQAAPGPGAWDQADIRDWTGLVVADPYPMLVMARPDAPGRVQTALLGCLGKCGVAARVGDMAGRRAIVRGSLIQRGAHAMIAVADGMDWIQPATGATPIAITQPAATALGEIELAGEILDSKCWFGAMRPSSGKVHKACAALCIRGGIPPAFRVRDGNGSDLLMILTDRGGPHGEALLPLVADPVRIRGQLVRRGDLHFLDAPVSSIGRI